VDVPGAVEGSELANGEAVDSLVWKSTTLVHDDDGHQGAVGVGRASAGEEARPGQVEEGDEVLSCEEDNGVDIELEARDVGWD
jgi:hypothetical protein